MKKNVVRILTAMLMLSMVFSSSVFAAEKTSAWDSFVGLFAGSANTAATNVGVEYRGHVENKGDFPLDGSWIQGPTQLGTVGEGLRLEAFWIKLTDAPAGLHIKYEVHVQNKGWLAPVEDGKLGGTQGEGLRIEAIKISLVDDNGNVSEDYKVEYRGHVQNIGDTAWYENGAQLGTTGSGLRLEALEVKIVKLSTDLTAYNAALAAVEEADYTEASWTAYKAIVDANVMTAANTQSEIDAATAAIIAAQADLVKKGASDVIPTSIALDREYIQTKVGTDQELKATVEVPAGASKENIPVVFSIDAPAGSINEDIVVTEYTDADGVATHTYKRASAGTDLVEVYPAKDETVRDTCMVYWGIADILTVTPDNTTAAANGTTVTYTVTLKNPANNVAVQGAVVNVTFLENVNSADGTTANDTTAVIADPNTGGAAVTPFQAASNERAFTVTTNTNGQATFTMTGANTTASPLVFVDSNAAVVVAAGIAGNGNSRVEASELQKQLPAVAFTGAQTNYTFDFSPMTAAEYASGIENARKYTAVVKKADGTVYANGEVVVGLDQLIDNNLFTNTSAVFADKVGVGAANLGSWNRPLTTDANGVVSFYVAEPDVNKSNVNATPAIWIDMDQAGFTNLERETGEPQALAPTTTFQAQLAQGSNLTINTDPAVKAGPFVAGDEINARFEIRNQSNTLSQTAGFNRVTYTITNTSGATVALFPRLTDPATGFNFEDMTSTFNWGTSDPFVNGQVILLNAGSSVTIAGTAPGFIPANATSTTNVANLAITAPAQDNELTISANGTTVKANLNSDSRNVGSVSQSAQTIVIKDATQATDAQNYTGEIIGYTIDDQNVTDNFGRIVVKLDGSGDIVWYNYGTNVDAANIMQNLLYLGTDGTFAFPDTNFNKIFDWNTGLETVYTQKAAFDKFEKALTIGNRISFDNTGGLVLPTFYLANIKGAAGSASGNDLTEIVIPVDHIATSVANDTDFDGFYDTVDVTFIDNVIASTVEIGDFTIEGATVQTVHSLDTSAVVNVQIIDGVLPISAQFPSVAVNAVTLDTGDVVENETQTSTNIVKPWIKDATTVQTNATATIAKLGQTVTVEFEDAVAPNNLATTLAGAFGNGVNIVVADGVGASQAATAVWNPGTRTLTVTSATDGTSTVIPLTILDVATLIDGVNGFKATMLDPGTPVVVAAGPVATFAGGTDVVTINFSKYIDANSVAATAVDFTIEGNAITGTSTVVDADTVETTITVAAQLIKGDNIAITNGAITSDAGANVSVDIATPANTYRAIN